MVETESSSCSPKMDGETKVFGLIPVNSVFDVVLAVLVLESVLSGLFLRTSFIGSASSKYEISSSYSPITISLSGSHLQPSIRSIAEVENSFRTFSP